MMGGGLLLPNNSYKGSDTVATLKATTIDGNLTQHGAILIDSSTYSYNTTSMPTALSYGRLQCYGTLNINADTDNSQTEYVILTSGHGCSSTTSDGLAIGYNTLTWKDNTIIHAGNLSNYYQNKTSVGHTPYASGNTNTNLLTVNDLAYWDGSHTSSGSSNLAYCNQGSFGTIITKSKDDYVLKTGDTITGDINRDAGGSWISARDHCIIKTTRTSAEGNDWHPAVGIKTSSGFWSFGSVGGETLAFSYDTDYNYTHSNNTSNVLYIPNKSGTLAVDGDAQPANYISSTSESASGCVRYNNSTGVLHIHSTSTTEKIYLGNATYVIEQFSYTGSSASTKTHTTPRGTQITLPTGAYTRGILISVGNDGTEGDYGTYMFSSDGCIIANSGDQHLGSGTNTEYVLGVYDKDKVGSNYTADNFQFGVKAGSGGLRMRRSDAMYDVPYVQSYSNGTLTLNV